MASPDFREYVDLTINDLQPAEIYELARDYALVSLPEFDPRPGSIEDALLEAVSYVAGLVTGTVNRLPNGLMEGILRLMGFIREEATFASGSVIFTAIDSTGLTIPAGTQISYTEETAEGDVTHIFETTELVVIAEGNTDSTPVQIAALEAGEKPMITDGSAMTILTPISRLFEATFDGSLTQGADSESDESFFNRATTYLASLSRSLATAEQVTNYVVSTYPDAFRVNAYDLTQLPKFVADEVVFASTTVGASFNIEEVIPVEKYKVINYTNEDAQVEQTPLIGTPFYDTETLYTTVRVMDTSVPDYDGIWPMVGAIDDTGAVFSYSLQYDYGSGTATTPISYPTQRPTVEFLNQVEFSADDALGSITVFVSGITGASVSAEDKAIIADDIRSKSIAGLNVYVTDVIVAPISVSVSIKILDGYSALEVRNAVDEYLTSYLSPAQYPFTNIIRQNALISQIAQIQGVDYVDSIELTSDNTDIAYESSGDIIFRFKGTLPSASVTVSSV